MIRVFDISRRAGLVVPTDFRYEHFFDYLLLSPSYRLAGRYRNGRIKPGREQLPPDFDEVLKTYDAFGDVVQIGFEQWWAEKAQFQFGIASNPRGSLLMKLDVKETASPSVLKNLKAALKHYLDVDRPGQGNRAMVVLALPIFANRIVMTHEFDRLLNESGIPLKDPKEIYPYRLIDNKIRSDLMDNAYRVTLYRAAHPEKKLLEIGMETGVSPATFNENTKDWDFEKRRDLENMTSRLIRKAYRLAENAARGRFPSLDSLPAAPGRTKFDYEALHKAYEIHRKFLEGAIEGKPKRTKSADIKKGP
jgi:hypothetical protein